MMDVPDWLWPWLSKLADVLAALTVLYWAAKKLLRFFKSPEGVVEYAQPLGIHATVGDAIEATNTVSSERRAMWNTHARVVSERPIIWNIEARTRLIDVAIEEAVWVLPGLVRQLLR